MYKNYVLAIALFVLALLVVPAAAQTNTDTPTPNISSATQSSTTSAEVTPEMTATLAPIPVDHVRIAYLAAAGSPVLTVYFDGAASNVQLLDAPTVTGWFDVPSSSTLSLVDVTADPNNAVIGPINPGRRWTTLVVTNDGSNGYQSFTINENLAAIPAGCARVTVLHTISGAPAFDLNVASGAMLASGVGMGAAGASGTPVPCGTPTDTSVNANGAVNCVALGSVSSTSSAETTPEATENASTSSSSTTTTTTSAGSSMGACGSTFDVPAGTYDLTFDPTGTTGSPITTASGTQFLENTYYLLMVYGTASSPQTFLASVPGSDLKNMIGGSNVSSTSASSSSSSSSSSSTSATNTPEATMELATATATP